MLPTPGAIASSKLAGVERRSRGRRDDDVQVERRRHVRGRQLDRVQPLERQRIELHDARSLAESRRGQLGQRTPGLPPRGQTVTGHEVERRRPEPDVRVEQLQERDRAVEAVAALEHAPVRGQVRRPDRRGAQPEQELGCARGFVRDELRDRRPRERQERVDLERGALVPAERGRLLDDCAIGGSTLPAGCSTHDVVERAPDAGRGVDSVQAPEHVLRRVRDGERRTEVGEEQRLVEAARPGASRPSPPSRPASPRARATRAPRTRRASGPPRARAGRRRTRARRPWEAPPRRATPAPRARLAQRVRRRSDSRTHAGGGGSSDSTRARRRRRSNQRHVRARAVGARPGRERELRALAPLADADAGEQAEWRRSGRHADEVAAKRPLELEPALATVGGRECVQKRQACDRERRLDVRRGGLDTHRPAAAARAPARNRPARRALHDSRKTASQAGSTAVAAARSTSATPAAPSRRPGWSVRVPVGSVFR